MMKKTNQKDDEKSKPTEEEIIYIEIIYDEIPKKMII